jgi:hypothetical protein
MGVRLEDGGVLSDSVPKRKTVACCDYDSKYGRFGISSDDINGCGGVF